nr:hypothetical protein [Xylanimonas protaetiae]
MVRRSRSCSPRRAASVLNAAATSPISSRLRTTARAASSPSVMRRAAPASSRRGRVIRSPTTTLTPAATASTSAAIPAIRTRLRVERSRNVLATGSRPVTNSRTGGATGAASAAGRGAAAASVSGAVGPASVSTPGAAASVSKPGAAAACAASASRAAAARSRETSRPGVATTSSRPRSGDGDGAGDGDGDGDADSRPGACCSSPQSTWCGSTMTRVSARSTAAGRAAGSESATSAPAVSVSTMRYPVRSASRVSTGCTPDQSGCAAAQDSKASYTTASSRSVWPLTCSIAASVLRSTSHAVAPTDTAHTASDMASSRVTRLRRAGTRAADAREVDTGEVDAGEAGVSGPAPDPAARDAGALDVTVRPRRACSRRRTP